jgi:hypothetical protein
VEGSLFHNGERATIKLEGSARAGYETLSFVGIADPGVIARLDEWIEALQARVRQRVEDLLDLTPDQYGVQLRCYGKDAVLGSLAANHASPPEVGVLLRVRASDQATATAIAKTANPLLLHLPLSNMEHLPSYAFVTSPAEIDLGAVYEFVLNHVVEVDDPCELFRMHISEVSHA